jgi:hypothetical protein
VHRWFGWMLTAVGVAVLLSFAASPGPAPAQNPGCPPGPLKLSPGGPPSSRFTMLIRVNKLENVGQYAQLQSAYGRIRAQDVFVINTRFPGSNPDEAKEILSALQYLFPCNRAVALNGLGVDPARPGYALSLVDSPGVWGVLLDWERRDWGLAKATNPAMSSWKRRFGRSVHRLGSVVGQVAGSVQAAGTGISKVGAAPSFFTDWQYGRIARMLDRHNTRFGYRKGGFQVVATQASCRKYRAKNPGMRKLAGRLFHQYGRSKRRKANLALQISFSNEARPKRHLPINSVNPGRAARCLRTAVHRGGGAVLLWASPESMQTLFATGRLASLRPTGG